MKKRIELNYEYPEAALLEKLKRSPYLRQFIAHLMEADCFFAKVFMDDGLHLFPHKHSHKESRGKEHLGHF